MGTHNLSEILNLVAKNINTTVFEFEKMMKPFLIQMETPEMKRYMASHNKIMSDLNKIIGQEHAKVFEILNGISKYKLFSSEIQGIIAEAAEAAKRNTIDLEKLFIPDFYEKAIAISNKQLSEIFVCEKGDGKIIVDTLQEFTNKNISEADIKKLSIAEILAILMLIIAVHSACTSYINRQQSTEMHKETLEAINYNSQQTQEKLSEIVELLKQQNSAKDINKNNHCDEKCCKLEFKQINDNRRSNNIE